MNTDRTSVFAQYSLLVQDRDQLQARLKEQGIPTAVHYPNPLNQEPAYDPMPTNDRVGR